MSRSGSFLPLLASLPSCRRLEEHLTFLLLQSRYFFILLSLQACTAGPLSPIPRVTCFNFHDVIEERQGLISRNERYTLWGNARLPAHQHSNGLLSFGVIYIHSQVQGEEKERERVKVVQIFKAFYFKEQEWSLLLLSVGHATTDCTKRWARIVQSSWMGNKSKFLAMHVSWQLSLLSSFPDWLCESSADGKSDAGERKKPQSRLRVPWTWNTKGSNKSLIFHPPFCLSWLCNFLTRMLDRANDLRDHRLWKLCFFAEGNKKGIKKKTQHA